MGKFGEQGKVNLKCSVCQKEFYRWPSYLKKYPAKFCSMACRNKRENNAKCLYCRKGFHVFPVQIKRGRKFCSRECYKKGYTKENSPIWKGGRQYRTYYTYKRNAKERGIKFNLTYDEFLSYWQKSCFYCGSEIKEIGIDRVNSNAGYSIDNIIPCCFVCNKMKLNYSKDYFIEHITKIYLAIRGDNGVIPEIKRGYVSGTFLYPRSERSNRPA